MGIERKHLTGGVIGLVLGVLLVSVIPAAAGNGDPLLLGEKNTARRVTKVTTRAGVVFKSITAGVPAASFQVASGAPIAVNSSVLVENLNSDQLDGMEAAAFAATDHRHVAGFDWTNDQVEITSSGDELDYLTVVVTNPDECGNGATNHLYIAQAAADIGVLSGISGDMTTVEASIGRNSLVVLDSADTSYRTERLWMGTDVKLRWSLATTGMFAIVLPGEHTFRLMLKHSNTGMTANAFGGSLIVWDAGHWCTEP